MHFGDNTSANTAATKGYGSAPDMARVVASLRFQWMNISVDPWIEFVSSKANWSGDPSRGDVALLDSLGAIRLEFVCPPFKGWK